MRDYKFKSLAPGESERLAVDGNFFRVKESAQPLLVEYELADGGRPATLTFNETGFFRLPDELYYNYIRIYNAGLETVDITVTLGFGDTGDNRMSGGVNVGNGESLAQDMLAGLSKGDEFVAPTPNLLLKSMSINPNITGREHYLVDKKIHSAVIRNLSGEMLRVSSAETSITAQGEETSGLLNDDAFYLVGGTHSLYIGPDDHFVGLTILKLSGISATFRVSAYYWEEV